MLLLVSAGAQGENLRTLLLVSKGRGSCCSDLTVPILRVRDARNSVSHSVRHIARALACRGEVVPRSACRLRRCCTPLLCNRHAPPLSLSLFSLFHLTRQPPNSLYLGLCSLPSLRCYCSPSLSHSLSLSNSLSLFLSLYIYIYVFPFLLYLPPPHLFLSLYIYIYVSLALSFHIPYLSHLPSPFLFLWVHIRCLPLAALAPHLYLSLSLSLSLILPLLLSHSLLHISLPPLSISLSLSPSLSLLSDSISHPPSFTAWPCSTCLASDYVLAQPILHRRCVLPALLGSQGDHMNVSRTFIILLIPFL